MPSGAGTAAGGGFVEVSVSPSADAFMVPWHRSMASMTKKVDDNNREDWRIILFMETPKVLIFHNNYRQAHLAF